LRARIAAAFATRTQQEWAEVFEGTEACVAPVLSLAEAAAHPHLAARGTFTDAGGVVQPAAAPRFSVTPPGPVGTPARPGAHTREVLTEWGLGEEDGWLDGGAVRQSL
jgi:alpha-methylacyl-CoA racemase